MDLGKVLGGAASWLTNTLGLTKQQPMSNPTTGFRPGIGSGPAPQIAPRLASAPNISNIATDYAGGPQLRALEQQTAALQAQIAAQPRLIYRDTNAAWQNAQNRAASSVNPVYEDNLNRKLKEMADARAQQQAATEAAKKAEDTTLTNTQQDIATARERTAQDTATAIAQNLTNEGNWQTQEGQQANAQEEAARLALGDQGIAGRGAGQLAEAKIQRNQASDVQTQSFENDRATKQMLQTRTFQDLGTKGTRATEFNTTQKANLDRTLNDFITNQGNEEANFKASNEAARLGALFQATQQQYQTDTASWLASLAKSGARNQDVALAYSTYGR